MKKNEFARWIVVFIAILAFNLSMIWTSHIRLSRETLLDMPPTLRLHGENYVRHNLMTDVIPQGYFMAGKLTEDMANNTNLEGYTYYINPYVDDIIYVYQEKEGLGDDSVKGQKWAYMSWINEDAVADTESEA